MLYEVITQKGDAAAGEFLEAITRQRTRSAQFERPLLRQKSVAHPASDAQVEVEMVAERLIPANIDENLRA